MSHITVSVGVVIHDAKILLIKRANPERNLIYQFPAGKVEEDEDTATGAIRETMEETGVVVQAIRCLGERTHPDTGAHLVYWACKYLGEVSHTAEIKSTIEEVLWIPITQIDQYIRTDLYPPVRKYLEERKSNDHP